MPWFDNDVTMLWEIYGEGWGDYSCGSWGQLVFSPVLFLLRNFVHRALFVFLAIPSLDVWNTLQIWDKSVKGSKCQEFLTTDAKLVLWIPKLSYCSRAWVISWSDISDWNDQSLHFYPRFHRRCRKQKQFMWFDNGTPLNENFCRLWSSVYLSERSFLFVVFLSSFKLSLIVRQRRKFQQILI